jgi:hypothetical protein
MPKSASAAKERRFSIRLSLSLQGLPTVKEGHGVFHENKIAGVTHRFCAEHMNFMCPVLEFVPMKPHEHAEETTRTELLSFRFVDPQACQTAPPFENVKVQIDAEHFTMRGGDASVHFESHRSQDVAGMLGGSEGVPFWRLGIQHQTRSRTRQSQDELLTSMHKLFTRSGSAELNFVFARRNVHLPPPKCSPAASPKMVKGL